MADDPDLVVALSAAGTYSFKAVLRVGNSGAGANGKIKVGFSHPGGSLQAHGLGPIATLTTGTSGTLEAVSQSSAASPTTPIAYGVSESAATSVTIVIEGMLVATGSGNFAVQWAQNASNAISTLVQVGSTFRVERLT
jgi:hypothetical protein